MSHCGQGVCLLSGGVCVPGWPLGPPRCCPRHRCARVPTGGVRVRPQRTDASRVDVCGSRVCGVCVAGVWRVVVVQ